MVCRHAVKLELTDCYGAVPAFASQACLGAIPHCAVGVLIRIEDLIVANAKMGAQARLPEDVLSIELGVTRFLC